MIDNRSSGPFGLRQNVPVPDKSTWNILTYPTGKNHIKNYKAHIVCIIGRIYCMYCQMMTSSNRKNFRVTGHLCGQFTGYRWIPPHKFQWREALMFSLIYAWINGWLNNREAGDWRHHRAHYDVTVMQFLTSCTWDGCSFGFCICLCHIDQPFLLCWYHSLSMHDKALVGLR